jgi:hypothetical protein
MAQRMEGFIWYRHAPHARLPIMTELIVPGLTDSCHALFAPQRHAFGEVAHTQPHQLCSAEFSFFCEHIFPRGTN